MGELVSIRRLTPTGEKLRAAMADLAQRLETHGISAVDLNRIGMMTSTLIIAALRSSGNPIPERLMHITISESGAVDFLYSSEVLEAITEPVT